MKSEAPEVHQMIGKRLRQLRKTRGVTLDTLAKSTGFTKSYLSKIENAKKVPPIASLARIAEALNTDLAFFFDANGEDVGSKGDGICVVRANERETVMRGGSSFGYDYQALAHKKLDKLMEPFIFTFPPHVSKDFFFEHAQEELFFVLSGRVSFEANGTKVVLEPGDCVYIGSNIPHRGQSIGEKATALVVVAKHDHQNG
ncbi:MAG: helix-turn-helix transcriptional regulator [Rhodospirillales bacterium]|jgi:transcriptional regulator with XRE-family HTH domain|nr:helix-turn-helix transcriptional regulator [Rhodospirillales bacterium]